MDKIKFDPLGGYGLDLEDFIFLQNSVRDCFKALTKIVDGDYIISGCNASLGVISQGYMVISGEIYYFPGAASPLVAYPNVAVWVPDVSNDSNGIKLLENGATHNAHEKRRAKIGSVHFSLASSYMQVGSEPRMPSKLVNVIAADNADNDLANKILAVIGSANLYATKAVEAWREIGGVGQPAFQNSWANNFGVRKAAFRKDSMGMVHLRGCIAGNNGSVIFTLPAGYRPKSNNAAAFSVPAGNGTNTNYVLFIDTNGDVSMGGAPGGAVAFYLNGIHFHTD